PWSSPSSGIDWIGTPLHLVHVHTRGYESKNVNQMERRTDPIDACDDGDDHGEYGYNEFAAGGSLPDRSHEFSQLPNESRLSCGRLRSPARPLLNDSRCGPAHNTTIPLKRSRPPASSAC